MDTENLFMLPINWLNHRKFTDFNVDILVNLYYTLRTPKYVFVEKDSESWDLKFHGSCNYLQNFYVAALIDKWGTTKNYPLAMC